MGSNLENDRSVTTSKMYPIDLAPQKVTIVKSVPNSDMKMTHLISGQSKASGPGQIITHTGPLSLMRPAAQIISTGVASQPQMIVSGSPIIQGTQLTSQGTQIISQGSQIISQPQLIGPGQLLTQSTQVISQNTQGNIGTNSNIGNTQSSVTPVTGTQVLNVSGQLLSGTGNLVVTPSIHGLSTNVRVLPQLPLARPVISSVNMSSGGGGVVVSKSITSHLPRGPVAGASLAVPRATARPITPVSSPMPISSLGTWSGAPRAAVRGALVYSARAALPRAQPPRTPSPAAPAHSPTPMPTHSAIVTMPTTTVLTSGVIAANIRGASPRIPTPTPIQATTPQRPLPLLQRNFQPAKVVGAATVSVRNPVGNSAPPQLYYEVSRPPTTHAGHVTSVQASTIPRVLTSYNHVTPTSAQMNVNNTVQVIPESRLPTVSVLPAQVVPRPSILRKRDVDGSPSKNALVVGTPVGYEPPRIEDAISSWPEDAQDRTLSRAGSASGSVDGSGSGGGSTTVSAASSPAPDDDPPSPLRVTTIYDISPRKKPRKQMLSSAVRQCDFTTEETPRTQLVPPAPPPPKRPLLSSGFVCGWRATALHFTRPADVRRREPRGKDIVALANQKHILNTADGWKVHHLTAQMDDLVSLESDVSDQLTRMLRALETVHGKAQAALAPHNHSLLELVKGNIQRSKIVCEGINESRQDILRVFTHRTFVADILTRQADKRCFRKHRSQS